jgi:hypothetical protein
MANRPQDFPVFTRIGKDTINQMALKITNYLQNLASFLKINTHEISMSEMVMVEIIERVEKRRVYFHIFHDGCNMGEINEGSLLCFWIIKLHPFHHANIDANVLNAKIALCLFVNVLFYYSDKTNSEKKIPKHFIDDLYYSFRFRDISKESIMLLSESLI